MKRISILSLLLITFVACDYMITGPTVTNNNTNTNNNDIHDLVDFNATFPPITIPPGSSDNPTSETPLSIPLGSEAIARSVPTTYLGQSCGNFKYLDAVVAALRAKDQRWGYICKTSCSDVSGDTIAYRATNTNTGVWAVDIIGNHCTTNPVFTWNVVGYAADRMWVGSH